MESDHRDLISSSELVEIRKTFEETRKSQSETFRFYIFINVVMFLFTFVAGSAINYVSMYFSSYDFRIYAVAMMLNICAIAIYLNYIANSELKILSYRSKALQTALVQFSRYQDHLSILEYEWKLLGDYRIESSKSNFHGLHGRVFFVLSALLLMSNFLFIAFNLQIERGMR